MNHLWWFVKPRKRWSCLRNVGMGHSNNLCFSSLWRTSRNCTPLPWLIQHTASSPAFHSALPNRTDTPSCITTIFHYRSNPPNFTLYNFSWFYGTIKSFSNNFSNLQTAQTKITFLGDFNIHVCCPPQSFTTDFMDILESLNLTPHPIIEKRLQEPWQEIEKDRLTHVLWDLERCHVESPKSS